MNGYQLDNMTVQIIPVMSVNISGNVTSSEDDYDSEGAMKFIVCTIVVYSVLGVFCMLVSSIKKSRSNDMSKLQGDAISKYLKKQRELILEGYHSQLLSQCSQYTEKIKTYEEKVRLLQIERDVASGDFGFRQFSGMSKRLTKKERRKKHKPPRRMSSVLGTAGFSLFYFPNVNKTGTESDTETESVTGEHVVQVEETDKTCDQPELNDSFSNVNETESNVVLTTAQMPISS